MPKSRARQSKPALNLRERAEEAVRTSRTAVASMEREDVLRLVDQLQVHQIELEMQNEELREAHAALEASRDRFNELYDFAPVGYVTLDHAAVVLEANLTAATMFGIQRNRLVGRKFTALVDRRAQDTLYLHQKAVLQSETKKSCELLLRGPDHTTFPARMETIVIRDEASGARHCLSAIIDISERKQAEEALARSHAELEDRVIQRTSELREAEQFAQGVVDALTAHIAIVDGTGRILAVNQRWRDFEKENRGSLTAIREGANYLAACDNATKGDSAEAKHVAKGIRDVLKGKLPSFSAEYHCHSPTEQRWFIVRVTPFPGDGARRVVIAHEDISARVKAELELVESERRERRRAAELAAILDVMPAGVLIAHDRECRHITGNRAADELLRSARGGEVSLDASDATRPSHFKLFRDGRELRTDELPAQRAARGFPVDAGELTIVFNDGSSREVLSYATPLRDDEGKLSGAVLVLVDITARKRAELALKESEARYRALFNTLIEGFCIIEVIFDAKDTPVNYRFLEVNPAFEKQSGLRNVEGKFIHEVVDYIEPHWFALFGEIARTGKPMHVTREAKVLNRWFEVSAFRFGEAGGRKLAILFNDITEAMRANLALRESEERYRQLMQGLPVAVHTCDAKGRVVLYNAAAVDLWGCPPDPRRHCWCGAHRAFTAEGKQLSTGDCPVARSVHLGRSIRNQELIIERPDGSRSHVLVFPDPTHDPSGAVTGAVVIQVDITALKVAENALRTSERKLRTLARAVEQSPASVVITSTTGEIEYVNPKFTEVTGFMPEEVLGKNPRILNSGQQPREYYKTMWETITTGQDWRGEFCNRKKSGELFWEFAVIAPIEDERGSVTHFVALKEDITERRKVAAELHESRERLRAILNTVADAILTIDRRGIIVGVNKATERLFGYSEEEMIGRNVNMLIPPHYGEKLDSHLAAYQRTGQGQARIIGLDREVQGMRKDGTIFPLELAVSEMEQLNLFTGIIRDITERRRLEAEVLRIAEDERMRVAGDLHDGIRQELAGIQFFAHLLRQKLGQARHPLAPDAKRIEAAITATAEHTREVARGMSPVVADGSGLMHALRQLAETTTRTRRTRCVFQCPAPVPIASPITANELYRIAQEAIHNAVIHGRGKRITVRLTETDGDVHLAVMDDGRGLPSTVSKAAGMGLRVMQYRANLIGGQLIVQPRKRGGTEVICLVTKTSAKP